jgi:hypothetical protein
MIFSIADLIIVGAMRTGIAALAVAATAVAGLPAQEPTLDSILARAAKYVTAYQQGLQGIVAEETYSQNVLRNIMGRAGIAARPTLSREARELRSDVLMVKLAGEDMWLQFRDVFEVDHRAVRDRDQRLSRLFVEAKADARLQAESIQNESARYNIGPVTRTINIPILALLFFEDGATNVQFTRVKTDNLKKIDSLADRDAIWVIEFRESGPGTLVRGANRSDLPSHGRAWIDSATGRILRTEHITDAKDVRATIEVTYRSEPGLNVLVPGEMRETYLARFADTRIDGYATYKKFRQFTVSTTEKPKP